METIILFLDLDGTVREPKSRNKFINQPDDQKIISGSKEALQSFAEEGYLIIGVTNQKGVSLGYKSITDCIKEQEITLYLLPHIYSILFCPNEGDTLWEVKRDKYQEVTNRYPKLKGKFRKPDCGMLEYISLEYGCNKRNSLMIGDMESDRVCAEDFGVRFKHSSEIHQV
jgi:D-glycero-D-manno-heptose 1,7-bisphosphate phosphatase